MTKQEWTRAYRDMVSYAFDDYTLNTVSQAFEFATGKKIDVTTIRKLSEQIYKGEREPFEVMNCAELEAAVVATMRETYTATVIKGAELRRIIKDGKLEEWLLSNKKTA